MKHSSSPLAVHRTAAATAILCAALACSDKSAGTTGPTDSTPTIGVQLGASYVWLGQGESRSLTVAVACTGETMPRVALSVTGVPSGVSVSFEPDEVQAGASGSTLSIAADINVPPGTYPLTITGTGSGATSHSATLLLVVHSPTGLITLQLTPRELTLGQGQWGRGDIRLGRGGSFTGAVTLGIKESPSGTVVTFDPPVIAEGVTEASLTISVGPNTPAGTHHLVVSASGDGVVSQEASLDLTVTPGQAALSVYFIASDDFVWTVQGDNWEWGGVRIARSSDYTGPVTLAIEGLPIEVTGSFDPPVLTGKILTSTVSFDALSNAPAGEYQLTIRASGEGVLDATTVFRFFVFPPWHP